MSKFPIAWKPTQKQFIKTGLSQQYSEILYAGTAGTGKSFTSACYFSMLCQDFDKIRIGVFRKNLTTARKTIFHTYIKALEMLQIPYEATRGSEPKIKLPESNSTIEFFEMDMSKDPDWNKLKGLELTAAHVEEGNEIDVSGKSVLITRIGRWNNDKLKPFIIITCNPSQGWVREDFRDPALEGTIKKHRCFIETTKEELEDSYRELLETLPESEYARYVENNWNYIDDPNQLIKYEWIKSNLLKNPKAATRMGVDVAREGNDRSVIAYATENELIDYEIINTNDVIALSDIVKIKSQEKNIGYENVRIDSIGIGGGVLDYLKRKGFRAVEYKSGYAVDQNKLETDFLYFKNLRAYDYWQLREGLRKGIIKIKDDPDLISELVSIKYMVTDKVIQIENKAEIKKRLGKSPDIADAVVMALSNYKKSNFAFAI